MMWLLRLLLLALIIFIVYRILSYAASPVRRLEFAKRRNKFYMIDDKKNIRINLVFTYNGFLFEGEKYVNPNDQKTVSSILLWPAEPYDTKLLDGDVYFLEETLKAVYPNAKISWKKS
ncbi:sigma-w pathway protein ysdB [Niallia sp. MER 6]|uniref:sigma-w pathway protein ysdB n=1 Tax=Niallia sp. MER 6 TaxID=2939567 RepID=UPI00204176A6|nr:sigma-w pathway protein ysdB [Niallia sp. MER 6]MCM3029893.1 sigma-w pathway protein ysdB [Niallia sp. MER 6]